VDLYLIGGVLHCLHHNPPREKDGIMEVGGLGDKGVRIMGDLYIIGGVPTAHLLIMDIEGLGGRGLVG
jgi:hypothetical protein